MMMLMVVMMLLLLLLLLVVVLLLMVRCKEGVEYVGAAEIELNEETVVEEDEDARLNQPSLTYPFGVAKLRLHRGDVGLQLQHLRLDASVLPLQLGDLRLERQQVLASAGRATAAGTTATACANATDVANAHADSCDRAGAPAGILRRRAPIPGRLLHWSDETGQLK
uniref:Uncharacterized protein n=1 Tax=Anopheles atroparvus TaxID=41427 RepID=A0A182IY38_ANOAO